MKSTKQAGHLDEPLIFEKRKDRSGYSLPPAEIAEVKAEEILPGELIREQISEMPEISELEVIRHFTRISQWNHSIDTAFYPLGSCTMKYNPKINERTAAFPGFAYTHPEQPYSTLQGNLELLFLLQQYLCEIFGMDAISLQPSAGAQGEMTGMMLVRACLLKRDQNPRKKILIPHSAHGTNPASAALCGYDIVELPANERGCLDLKSLTAAMNEDVAALMITNPNTVGLFEEDIGKIAQILHAKGGFVYLDGANMNAVVGVARPGDFGADVMHLNLHKTFSTPHGGGGPGAGPVLVKSALEPFLPVPRIVKKGEGYSFSSDFPDSIGKIHSFYGNFRILVRAYTYLLAYGSDHIRNVAELAVLNANYLRVKLKENYHLPYDRPVMHEVIFSDKWQLKQDVKTLDIAKRLMDYGFHPPTIYFPLIVPGAMMIEPTETESLETLDAFVEAMKKIDEEAKTEPETVKSAPHTTKISRLDEAEAARRPVLRWKA
ncbi:aminomethyl-transferring glycine dehydrogenase subunit GcvPB [bacterium]|nr:aminomethyl-transferring glycine dehydrogenase subunit GcvPB [bacterium]MCI0602991.1 aminomethyl-transferring glycine dehydrogenase subunit GcvPB [bacterium]